MVTLISTFLPWHGYSLGVLPNDCSVPSFEGATPNSLLFRLDNESLTLIIIFINPPLTQPTSGNSEMCCVSGLRKQALQCLFLHCAIFLYADNPMIPAGFLPLVDENTPCLSSCLWLVALQVCLSLPLFQGHFSFFCCLLAWPKLQSQQNSSFCQITSWSTLFPSWFSSLLSGREGHVCGRACEPGSIQFCRVCLIPREGSGR